MLNSNGKNVSLLDCTLRDGGYYTNWDFSKELVQDYFKGINELPVDIVEVGYRSKEKEFYCGAYFYLPEYVLNSIREWTSKKLAIILNEKDVRPGDLDYLLRPCYNVIDMVRIAVAPENFRRAIKLASAVKKKGFTVSFNLMYASKWNSSFPSENEIEEINNNVDIFYVVDSYGGMFPQDVANVFQKLDRNISVKKGFHGHNNLEMALANSLAAYEAGADFLDSTICGMGRGAGNLKTELLLTVFRQKHQLKVNFDVLNSMTAAFEGLQEQYKWGTNLFYIASGAFSLPQDTVLSHVKKRYFSLNSIISEVAGLERPDLHIFPSFQPNENLERVLIVGGGKSPRVYREALKKFLKNNADVGIIFASSKNVDIFKDLNNVQYHCLPGMEGKRFESLFPEKKQNERYLLLAPESFSAGEYIPQVYKDHTLRLKSITGYEGTEVSATAMAFEIARQLSASTILLSGYDGYKGSVTKEEMELFEENQQLFSELAKEFHIFSLTTTEYAVPSKSIFALV